MRRRLGIAALVAFVLLSAGGAVAWFVWIPAAIADRVVEAAARRGLRASVGGVDVGFDRVILRNLELISEGGALVVHLDEIDTGTTVVALATDGLAAVRRLSASGLRFVVHVDDADLPADLRALRGRGGAPEEPSSERAELPAIDVTGVEAVFRDVSGVFLRIEDGTIQVLPEDRIRLESGPVALAPGESDGATIEGISLRGHRSDEGWLIDSFVARRVAIRYREREGEAPNPLWVRLRARASLISVLAAAEGEDEPTGESADDAVPAGEEGDGAGPSRLEAIARLAAVVGSRLAPGASLRLEDLSVVAHSDEGERQVLRELRSEARALPENRYRLQGAGRPGRGGRLGWDLTVDPDRLRAEGNVDFQRLPFVLLVPFLPSLPWHDPEDTTISGALTIRGDSASRVHIEGEAAVENLALSSERIARSPVRRIAMSFSGEADWNPLERRLEVSRAQIGLGDARAHLSGSIEWPEDHFLVDVTATLPPTECNTAVSAIPADLLAEATAFTFRGRIGGQVVLQMDSRDLDATVLRIDVADGCIFETVPAFADIGRFSTSFVHRVVEPDGTEFQMETGPETLRWTPISQVSPFFVQAVLGHEDGGFFRHSGFSVPSIRLALIRNIRQGRYVYGASTITMQLVKNVFLHREKTLARKVQEVLLTWWIESVMQKQQIIELYLNVIEFGPEIYGIRAASMHYFGCSPAQLGPAQSAYLATILPNPKGLHSHWEQNQLPDRHRRRVARFIRTLGSRARYDAEAVEYALAELEHFEFHQPGETVGLPPENRGGVAPLPLDTAVLDTAAEWDEHDEDPFIDEEGSEW